MLRNMRSENLANIILQVLMELGAEITFEQSYHLYHFRPHGKNY